jgi:hypothetical protein
VASSLGCCFNSSDAKEMNEIRVEREEIERETLLAFDETLLV